MIPKSDMKIETIRGKGPGGQHKNKTDSMVRITHLPTGIVVSVDGRHQHRNKKQAIAELTNRIRESKLRQQAARKKARRDVVIHERTIVRTYNFSRGVVTDHRTKKCASIKDVIGKGRLDKLA